MPSNRKLEQQVEFLKNITRLLEFADGNDYALVLDITHLDVKCKYGRSVHNNGLSLAFKVFGRTAGKRLDYLHLESNHKILSKYWLSLDTRCAYEDRVYSMPWTAPDT